MARHGSADSIVERLAVAEAQPHEDAKFVVTADGARRGEGDTPTRALGDLVRKRGYEHEGEDALDDPSRDPDAAALASDALTDPSVPARESAGFGDRVEYHEAYGSGSGAGTEAGRVVTWGDDGWLVVLREGETFRVNPQQVVAVYPCEEAPEDVLAAHAAVEDVGGGRGD